ncbi:MAG: hypothetical protein INR62_14285, partial [Rhodospirillales bacterium]|nr:hypothetical protein [Acetobacter sp.]
MQTRSEVIEALAATIRTHGIDPVAAATEIGVTAQSLVRHLAGGYVRSDSLAKYRRWLTGISTVADEHPPRQRDLINVENTASTPGARRADRSKVNGKVPARRAVDPQPTADAFRVVETFSGCGGLSLGFDLFNGANTFRTVLAMDIEKAMVNSYNWSRGTTVDDIAADVCRQTDLSDFLNEAEIVAFYLDHIATHENDRELRSHLDLTPGMSLAGFKEQIADIDAAFIVRLRDIYSSSEFKQEQRRMPEASRLQTSVSGFFDALRLPTAPGRQEMLAPLVWSSALSVPSGDGRGRQDDSISAQESLLTEADKLWEDTVQTLTEKAGKRGARGQLASSANRIAGFVEFLGTAPMREVKVLWTEWYARRKNLRTSYFTDGARRSHLLAAYEAGKEVAVVLGGPPCQGFSRIGRGKIRSLLETGVQVHLDPESGDA